MQMNNLMQAIQQLKSQYQNPQSTIQQMLNSGKVTQAQYDNAVRQAQAIQQMMQK